MKEDSVSKKKATTQQPLLYFYQLDLSGNTFAVYNLPSGGNITQLELPIYGLDRLGIYKKADGVSSYEIKDHLGNVRAVIEKESGLPAIKSYVDYYPFGELLPSRNTLNYRYAFQGQELDQDTQMEAFQLRLWDGRLGRWISPDPMGQYSSPYLGMGNNPISMTDPNGGIAIQVVTALVGGVVNAGINIYNQSQNNQLIRLEFKIYGKNNYSICSSSSSRGYRKFSIGSCYERGY